MFLTWISVIAMASKYILAPGKKHFLNPAAISVAIVGFVLGQSASWWVANIYLLPFVAATGYLLVRKIKRADLVLSFFTITILTSLTFSLVAGQTLFQSLLRPLAYSPILFFAFIMLTEPMSIPPSRMLRIIYGLIVGFLFVPNVHIGSFYFSPELALIIGNFFVYIVSPDYKLILKLDRKIEQARGIFDFVFVPDRRIDYLPGQYMEITLEHERQDSRGIRRYLTIASSPTEESLMLGVKFYEKPSSFKKALIMIDRHSTVIASQLAGDFVLPKDLSKKLVFIAGGIGITPFRAMIKYMLDTGEKRNVTLLYANMTINDIAYKNIFDEAEHKLGIKTIYSFAENIDIMPDGRTCYGLLNEKDIVKEVPDYKERLFYISGPNAMVAAFEKYLKDIGVKKNQIKTDYFPGFA